MNINRHNYEEFFLLYVDNELTAGQRKIVEAFVAANPDLQEEFDLINQSTFTADAKLDDVFMQSLLKPAEKSSVNEEQLLLYVDDELPAAVKADVEKELLTDTNLQNELLWLRRSQVEADISIVFPDKQLLYKQAEPARVFSFSVTARRWSAAAAIIVMLGSAMWLLINKEKTSDPATYASAETGVTKPATSQGPASVKKIIEVEKQLQAVENGAIAAVNKNNNNIRTNNTKASSVVINTTQSNMNNTNGTTEPSIDVITTTQTDDTKNNSDDPGNISTTPTVQSIETSTATNNAYTLYKNDVAAVDNEEDNELLSEERQRRTGITGLLRKAKRTFERKTGIESGSSEVRFSVFAIHNP